MKTLTFIAVTIFSGSIAGIFLGLINQAIVEPFIDKAISIETQRHIATGESIDTAQQTQYRLWQKGGEVVAATIYYREILYVSFVTISGFTTLVLALAYGKLKMDLSKKVVVVPLIYGIVMLSIYLIFPPNPDKVTMPTNLITSFRVAAVITIGIFWGVLGMSSGLFWDRLKLDETTKVTSSDAFLH